MNTAPVIDIQNLVYRYDRGEAVNGLNLTVEPGQCYGFLGRNGAGKTTTIKCLLNLLRPDSGMVNVFGKSPQLQEAEIKGRLSYVPDAVAFYPWMSVRDALDYLASFRRHWNRKMEKDLLGRFQLDPRILTTALSKGQRTQVALIGAVCPEPDLLVLDEPTSGLDPLVRREFVQTVIGAYQDAAPGERTVFVSTHLISEFEGLIDHFTIIDRGRAILTSDADAARANFRRLRAAFESEAPQPTPITGARMTRRDGRWVEWIVSGEDGAVGSWLKSAKALRVESQSLALEEIFLAAVAPEGGLP